MTRQELTEALKPFRNLPEAVIQSMVNPRTGDTLFTLRDEHGFAVARWRRRSRDDREERYHDFRLLISPGDAQ